MNRMRRRWRWERHATRPFRMPSEITIIFISPYNSRPLAYMRRDDRKAKVRRLGAYLPADLRAALNRRADEELRLRQAWISTIPEPLASHARPVRYAAGLLFVHADTPAWAGRLRHQQSTFVEALRRASALHDLTDLRVRVVPPDSNDDSAPSVRRPSSRLSAKAALVIEGTASSVSDPDLRAALKRLAQRDPSSSSKR
jgi:hypothetical protein